MMHVQISRVSNEVFEIAIRGNSVECNRSSSKYKAVRIADKCWAIVSSNRNSEKELIERAKEIASREGEGVRLADAKMAVGEFRFEKGHFDEEESVELLLDLKKNFEGFVEMILTHERICREIETSDGADAREEKNLTDLNLSVLTKSVASIYVGGVGGLEVVEENYEFIIDEVKNRVRSLERARYLNPLMRGIKMDVILSKETSCAFVHEIVHNLEADVLDRTLEDGNEITVYDDPTDGFGCYNFDDEGVVARRKCLIKDGRILYYLHTRETAEKFKQEPMGNGRGICTIPKAFESNLFVEKGGWRFDEMIEETREGFVAEGLIKAEIQNRVIYIYPEICWYIKNGEIVCPTIVDVIRIPLRTSLKRIKAIGKEYFTRIGYEKGFAISERCPPIMITASVS